MMGINEYHRQTFKMTPHPWIEALYSTYNLTNLLSPSEEYLGIEIKKGPEI